MSRLISIMAGVQGRGRRGPNISPPVGDVTAPTFVSAAVANASPSTIVITYSESLSVTLTGAMTVGGATRTVSSQTVVGSTVEVVVSAPYANGDTITVTAPSGCVKDVAGNSASALAAQAVTNNVAPASGIKTDFDALYAGGFLLNSDQTYLTRPTQAKPTVKSTGITDVKYTDQRFGTKVFMTTNAADVSDPNGALSYMRNDYAKRQMWNADESRFLAAASNGYWHLYNADTFAHINVPGHASGRMPGIAGTDCDAFWHPTDPNKLWYHLGALTWYELDITTGVSTTLFTFAGRLPSGFSAAANFHMAGEGRPSNDGRYWCLMADSGFPNNTGVGIITYDRQTDTITSSLATTNKPNTVGMSQLGGYAMVHWSNYSSGLSISAAAARPVSTADGTRAYHGGVLSGSFTQLDNMYVHGDVGVDKSGNECFFSQSFSPFHDADDGGCYMRRLSNGALHVYTNPNLNAYGGAMAGTHFSCANFNRPGYGVMTFEYGSGGTNWRDGTILIVELSSTSPKVYRVAHHQSIVSPGDGGADYFSSPFATPNRDLTRINYGSDFRSNATPINQMMVGLSSTCFPA